MKQLIPFAGAALLLLHAAAPQNFKSVLHSRICDEAVNETRIVGRPCECRQHCVGNCTGVSVSTKPPASYACAYTQRATFLPSFMALLTPDSSATAYFRDQGCMPNFTLVDGVGCIFRNTKLLTNAAANSSCPDGSSLFASSLFSVFDKMRNYLIQVKENDDEDDIWIGLYKSPDLDTTWRWNGGGTIRDQKPNAYWGEDDPNDGSDCAKVKYLTKINSFYHLADAKCTNNYVSLCKQL